MENLGHCSPQSSPDIESIAVIEQSFLHVRADIVDRIRALQDQREHLDDELSTGLLTLEDYRFFVDDIKYLLEEQFKLLLSLES
jgi:hypothetical protein